MLDECSPAVKLPLKAVEKEFESSLAFKDKLSSRGSAVSKRFHQLANRIPRPGSPASAAFAVAGVGGICSCGSSGGADSSSLLARWKNTRSHNGLRNDTQRGIFSR